MSARAVERSILPGVFEGVGFERGGVPLLAEVSLRFEAGKRSLILGPNGSGKSLTLRLAHGLLTPSSGRITWGGDRPAVAASRQAMVFETPVLLRRSARANVEYALGLHGVARAERADRAEALLARVGLGALSGRKARVLSAGEGQRLALARAFATGPEVLFLDEPTAALDPHATRLVEGIIESAAEEGTKIVMTSHDLGQARRLADEVLFFASGRLQEQTPAAEFFEAPRSDGARAFLRGDLLS